VAGCWEVGASCTWNNKLIYIGASCLLFLQL
jgi:hypothetical protein